MARKTTLADWIPHQEQIQVWYIELRYTAKEIATLLESTKQFSVK